MTHSSVIKRARILLVTIEKKRKMMGMESLKQAGREARHIGSAAKLGLGTDRIDRIDSVNLSV